MKNGEEGPYFGVYASRSSEERKAAAKRTASRGSGTSHRAKPKQARFQDSIFQNVEVCSSENYAWVNDCGWMMEFAGVMDCGWVMEFAGVMEYAVV